MTESRCHHDLLRISCIWCTPRPGVEDITGALDDYEPRTVEPTGPRWAQASHRSTCSSCDDDIRPGDDIRLNGRQTLCKSCGEIE